MLLLPEAQATFQNPGPPIPNPFSEPPLARRKRIAKGSGTTVQDVNRLVKQFNAMQKMMKQMSRPSRRGRGGPKMPSLPMTG